MLEPLQKGRQDAGGRLPLSHPPSWTSRSGLAGRVSSLQETSWERKRTNFTDGPWGSDLLRGPGICGTDPAQMRGCAAHRAALPGRQGQRMHRPRSSGCSFLTRDGASDCGGRGNTTSTSSRTNETNQTLVRSRGTRQSPQLDCFVLSSSLRPALANKGNGRRS